MWLNNYKTQQLHINPIKSQKQITKIHHPKLTMFKRAKKNALAGSEV